MVRTWIFFLVLPFFKSVKRGGERSVKWGSSYTSFEYYTALIPERISIICQNVHFNHIKHPVWDHALRRASLTVFGWLIMESVIRKEEKKDSVGELLCFIPRPRSNSPYQRPTLDILWHFIWTETDRLATSGRLADVHMLTRRCSKQYPVTEI